MNPAMASDPTPSTMSITPLPPDLPTTVPSPDTQRALMYLSGATLIAAPALMLVPPRKLDLYTLTLLTSFGMAASWQMRARTGEGVLEWAGGRWARARGAARRPEASSASSPPPGAPTQVHPPNLAATRWRAQEQPVTQPVDPWARRGAALGFDGRRALRLVGGDYLSRDSRQGSSVAGGRTGGDRTAAQGVAGVARRVWYGDESAEDWVAHRAAEEREAEEQGKGVGERIAEQVWEVWNQEQRPRPSSVEAQR